jgi:predicted nucleic acid-binding protein
VATALLDTSFFIDLWNGDAGARRIWADILSGVASCAYSPVTTFELWVRAISDAEAAFYGGVFFLLESADLTHDAARFAAGLLYGMGRNQRERLFRDALIAGTARSRGEAVYTRNVRDFRRFDVEVRSY